MNAVAPAKWNELVTESDHSRVYHLHQWGTLLEEVHGHRLVYLQEDEGVFPLAHIKSSIFGNRLISLPFADYGGLCSQYKGTAEKLILQSTEIAQQMGVDFVEIRCPHQPYFEPLERHGFVRRDDYFTFVLTLDRSVDELWRFIDEKKMKKMRKAERNGVRVMEATQKADVKVFYALYQRTVKRLGSPPQPYQFFDRMWDMLYPQNVRVFLAMHEGTYIAGKLILLHHDVVQQAYSCSLRQYFSLAPNDLLQWHIIKWGSENGFTRVNFGRTREDEGTELFKRQWGGQVVKMPYFYRFYKKALKERQEIQYKWISRFWAKYTPEFIANRIGPWIVRQVG